uniref:Uncharacterized protein n=1 Tax=Acrobeloides nanus TaxID=290746 RepID=A0A914D881_9BILA
MDEEELELWNDFFVMDQGLVDENREIEDGDLIADEEMETLLEPEHNSDIEVNGNMQDGQTDFTSERLYFQNNYFRSVYF